MVREKINSKNENFIGCWKINNQKLFSSMVNFFENNPQLQVNGTVSSGNKNTKKTTDISIFPSDLNKKEFTIFKEYFDELHKCYVDYQIQWPFLKENISTLDISTFNLQRYNPGDHFSTLHCERDISKTMHRVFAWMTYLNDIKSENGKTHFSHYDIKIKPEMGKTLIWPAEWTHAHSGEILKTETKYIITGWMCFPVK
tara:strand:- start:448 stop:1044 length:597 start_codon:yes stop_codon:yes gene_type:complete